MVASYIFVALLASQVTLAAPVDRKPALVEVDLLNDDSANVLEVDVNSQRKPTLSSRLFGKRALHRTSGSQDEDNDDLLDVTILEDDHFHHDHLLTADVGRRTAQTTGDVISGPDAGLPHEPAVRQLR